ncbi:MAG: flagellar hook-length control protein FliK [Planctomycetes bacterium]|nr:flagellar hook-length control protein FliK [Planctomycetota bacterium]
MNPVRQLKVDAHWDAMNQSAALKAPEDGFGQMFDRVRSEMEQPMQVRQAERELGQQERSEHLERDLPDNASQGARRSEDPLPAESDEIRDGSPSDTAAGEQPTGTVEGQNGTPVDEANPVEGDAGAVDESSAVKAVAGEAEAVAVVNAAMANKAIQSTGQANVAAKGQQVETPVVNSGLNVKNQNLEAAELIGQQNQTKGESKGQENGTAGGTVNMAKQLFAEADGDKTANVIKQDNAGSKEASGAQVVGPQSKIESSSQQVGNLDVLNKTAQDQSSIMGEHRLNATTKGEQHTAQAAVTQKPVIEVIETVGNDQAFSGQGFNGRSSQEQGSLEQALSNQGKGEVDAKIGHVNRIGNIAATIGGEGTHPVDMQENVDRVVKAARASINNGSARIQIRLEPPELGYLRVDLKQGGNGLHLLIQATNVKAQQMLQQNRGDLQTALEAHGIQTNKIDIQLRLDLNNDQTPGQSQEDYQQQAGSHHTDSQDQSNGDGFGQGGSEPSPDRSENDARAVGSEEVSNSTSWQELEFSRLDVHA